MCEKVKCCLYTTETQSCRWIHPCARNSNYLVVRYGVQYNGSSKFEVPNHVLTGCLHPALPAVDVYLQRHRGCDMSFSHGVLSRGLAIPPIRLSVVLGSAAFGVRCSFAYAVLIPRVTKNASCSPRGGRDESYA
jgi:hypothetical protein